MKTKTFEGVEFDDYELKADDSLNDWSQICTECKNKHNVDHPEQITSLCSGSPICGVEGCNNPADFYIDFPDGKLKD